MGRIAWEVAVHMGKTDDLAVEVIHLVVDADMIMCFVVFVFYSSVEITRGAARGDIFARHLAAHQRIWN